MSHNSHMIDFNQKNRNGKDNTITAVLIYE